MAIAPRFSQAQVRAEAVKTAVDAAWRGEKRSERDGLTLIFDRPPAFVRNKRGEAIGVDAMVRLFNGATEVPVDPHRVIINPPTVPRANLTYIDGIDGEGYPSRLRIVGEPDPAAAFEEAIWDSVLSVPNAAGWRTRGTVTTVYATAPVGEGYVRSTDVTYATARTGAGLGVFDNHQVGQQLSGGNYYCRESFIIFDTSGVPDGDTVSAVVLSLDGAADSSTTDFIAGVAASAYNGGPVVTGDWVSGASIPTPEVATWNSSGYSAGYNAFTETASFAAAINKTGNTSLILYSQRHRDATAPPDNEFVSFTDADAAGTTEDPKLDITHAAAAIAAPQQRPPTVLGMDQRRPFGPGRFRTPVDTTALPVGRSVALVSAETGRLDLTIYDTTGATVQGTGPLTVLSADISEKLNEVRTFSCRVPALEATASDVASLRPNGAGTYTQFDETVGIDWEQVDEETTDEDSTYIKNAQAANPGAIDSFALPDSVPSDAAVSQVRVVFRARRVAAEAIKCAAFLRSGSTDAAGTQQTLTGSYADYEETWETDPATGITWTAAAINALEAGVQTDNVVLNDAVQVTQVYVEVTYTSSVLVVARQVKLSREGDGVIFTGYIEALEYMDQGDAPVINVTGVGLEIELVEANVYYGVNLTGTTSAKVTQLLALVTDSTWTATVEGGIYAVADYRIDGMSIWASLVDLAQKAGGYIRLTTTTREVELAAANAVSGLMLTNVEGQVPASLGANIGLIAALRGYREDASLIVNRVVPYGAGQGDLPLSLAKSTRTSPYTIQVLTPSPIPQMVGEGVDAGFWLLTYTAAASSQERTQGMGRRTGHNRLCLMLFDINSGVPAADETLNVRLGGRTLIHYGFVYASLPGVISIWYLIDPPLGEEGSLSYTADLPAGGGIVTRPQIFLLSGVDPDDPIIATYSASGSSNSAAVTATASGTDDLLVQCVMVGEPNINIGADAAWDALFQIKDVNYISGRAHQRQGTGGSVTCTESLPASYAWLSLIVRLRAARTSFIEDATSQASYRTRSAIYQAKDVHLLATDVAASANALYDAAATYLTRAKDPLIYYGETVPVGLGVATWALGNTIRLMYRGLTTDRFGNIVKWLDVDANAILLEQQQTFGEDGVRRWKMRLASAIKSPPTLLGLMGKVDELARLPAL